MLVMSAQASSAQRERNGEIMVVARSILHLRAFSRACGERTLLITSCPCIRRRVSLAGGRSLIHRRTHRHNHMLLAKRELGGLGVARRAVEHHGVEGLARRKHARLAARLVPQPRLDA